MRSFLIEYQYNMYKRDISICIIVDAYSTGKAITPLLNTYSFKPLCIHIKSSPDLPTTLQHNEADFNHSLEYDGKNLEALISEIQKIASSKPIQLIIAGSESGVELTDTLNAIFSLPGNDPSRSHLRRNKFLMNEAVKEAGVKTVEQIKTHRPTAILEWSKILSADAWPIVLKPLDSQSGDHVFFCNNDVEIQEAFFNISSSSNLFGQSNQEVLAQGFNDGEEFIVNSVSYGSQHFIVEIWRIKKSDKTTIYVHADLVDPVCREFDVLYRAASQVLDAVGTRYGAGTTEFKLHPEKGAVFLETTSRPMASSPLNIIHELLGYNQVTVMLEALLTPDLFLQRLSQPLPSFTEDHYGLIVVLISDAEGIYQEELADVFKDLSTYRDCKIDINRGSEIKITVDSLTSPGEVYLIGRKEEVMKDYNLIRTYEKSGLYRNNVLSEERSGIDMPTHLISIVNETFFGIASNADATTLIHDGAELN